MKFTKMHGIGNDYVYVDCTREKVKNPGELSKFVSDRHFGIGSDGLVLICHSEIADVRMEMYNADGSQGEMCGNAIRCVGKYVFEHQMADKTSIEVETKAGIKQLDMKVENQKVVSVTVDMGIPEVTSKLPEPITVEGQSLEFIGISVGNPHAVYFTEDVSELDLEKTGPFFENHRRFPNRVNSEFVKVIDRRHIRMRVWERGSGETWACGTGAAASAVASILMGYTDDTVEVILNGGKLTIYWNRDNNHVFMTGSAEEVFHGEIDWE